MRIKLKLSIDIWNIPRDSRSEVFLQRRLLVINCKKSRNNHGYSVVLFYEEYFYTLKCEPASRLEFSEATKGERIVPRKSVQRDTGKISTLNEFPGFFQSFSFACRPAERSEKRIRSMKSITGSWARWMAPATCVCSTRELILIRLLEEREKRIGHGDASIRA